VDTATFVDGIGRRVRIPDSTGEEVETLRLCRELSEAPSTEPALIERAGRLAGFTHPGFAPVKRVERLRGTLGGLAVVSASVPGLRLADVLSMAQRRWMAPNFDAAMYLLEQIAAGMTAFHRHSRDFSHGTLGPERIIVRPDGHPVIVEHVLAPAIGQMQLSRAALWAQFRVPAPAVAGAARLDQMTDIMQLGVLALALILGRPIRREEFPQKLQDLLGEASTPGALGPRPPIARSLHGWILRTLQFETRAAFRTMADASAALDALVASQPRHQISPAAVVAWLAECQAPGSAIRPPATAEPAAPDVDARPEAVGHSEAAAPPPVHRDDDPTVTTRRFRSPATTTSRLRSRGGRVGRSPIPDESRRAARIAKTVQAPMVREGARASIIDAVSRMVRGSARKVAALDWTAVRRGIRVAIVAAGLVGLFGATYLGARGYFGLPSLVGGTGTLVVESLPTGAELYVDGLPRGRTPATLELKAGEHTLSLRSGKRTTLVPVVVVTGARRVERVEIRQKRQVAARPAASAVPAPTPAAPVAPATPSGPGARHP
jgi:hypothetical protein